LKIKNSSARKKNSPGVHEGSPEGTGSLQWKGVFVVARTADVDADVLELSSRSRDKERRHLAGLHLRKTLTTR